MPAVSDSSPLIWLSKAGRLILLKELYGSILIPEEVYKETVVRGLAEGFADALAVNEAIKEGWITVSTPTESDKELSRRIVEHAPEVHKGEAEAITMARRTGLPLLMDEASGRAVAETFGLRVRGTVYVVLRGLKEGCLRGEEAKETMLRLVEKGFRIEPRLLSRILRAIEAHTTEGRGGSMSGLLR